MVDFLFIGPDKSGSSWIDSRLREYSSAVLPYAKETFFFDRYYRKGIEWYDARFPPEGRPRGEICHDYLFSSEALARIAAIVPSATLIVSLRDPLDRAFSAYRYMQLQGRLSRQVDFASALATTPELLEHGSYGRLLTQLRETCPKNPLSVLLFDQLVSDPQEFWDELTSSLGLDFAELPEGAGSPIRPMAGSRWPSITRAGRRVGEGVRRYGRPEMVSWVKESTVFRRIFITEAPRDRPELAGIRAAYAAPIAEDLRRAESIIGIDLAARWGYGP